MIEDERREILESVAEGKLSPADAALLLETLDLRASSPASTGEAEVTAIRVVGTFRTLRIEGDPSVNTAVAEGGTHRVRTENGTMIFDADPDDELPGYVLFGPRPHRRGRVVHGRVEIGGRRFSLEGGRAPVLSIRMNPDLPLEVQMTAGSARVRGIRAPIIADLTAGSARFEGVRSPFRAEVDAGSVNVSGLFDRGDSSIRCTAGKVGIVLERESSVRITARTTMGKVSLPGDRRPGTFIGGGKQEAVIGKGEATLDLEATTGAVSVDLE